MTCTVLAVVVTTTRGFVFEWKVTLTPVPFSLIGLALAIFLGFRNNAAYDRYWEARKLWGDLLHRSRTFARQLQSLSKSQQQLQAVTTCARFKFVGPSRSRTRCVINCATANPTATCSTGCRRKSSKALVLHVAAVSTCCTVWDATWEAAFGRTT